ncbi:MAG: cobyrinate a,c-diamide synthase [Arachnia sp.]
MVIPRIVIAAPASGHGKTTVATGVMAALRERGTVVAPFKVGPDYIDPGYHTLAAGRPGRNLDPFLCGEDLMAPLLLHGSEGADVAIVEGVMGLFDGRLGAEGFASTAHVARLIDAPVVLVVDARHASRSVGALVLGMATFDADLRIAGVVLNQIGSPRHEAEARAAVEGVGVPVLGVLPRNLEIEAPSRHLGLVPAAEREDAGILAMGRAVAAHVDLDALLALARTAAPLEAEPWQPFLEPGASTESTAAVSQGPAPEGLNRPKIAIAGGRAFTFRYPETDELLVAGGCEPVVFDPLTDTALPEGTAGLWLGGGFPEVHATDLAGNESLRAAIRAAVADGMPTVAECAGLLYLCRELDGQPMVGALPGTSAMTKRLTMGYREATAEADSLLGRVGETVTGHEFHRTAADPGEHAAWLLEGRRDGVATPTLHASYLHVHWAGHPQLARRFTDAVHAYARSFPEERATPFPEERATRFPEERATSFPEERAKRASRRVPEPSPPEERATSFPEERAKRASRRVPEPSPPEERATSFPEERATSFPEERAERASRRVPHLPADPPPDLDHHGDKDLGPGLVDFAVNVRQAHTPVWLVDAVTHDADWAAYPDARPATAAIAAHHGVGEDMVLPVAGAAEAFTLIARALGGEAVVVHPQFTEPEAALRAAGRVPHQHVLRADDGFRLDPAAVPAADLTLVGNPTNPTAVLHQRADLLALRTGVLVVDEAFMDTVPGEPETLIAPDMPSRLVLRSLTKTWAVAGLRVGYVVGDPALVALLRAQQAPWSVSTPAVAATVACLAPERRAEAERLAHEGAAARADLADSLRAIGLEPVDGVAPFVLVDTAPLAEGSLREALAARGYAVRRGETFPGLGPTWLRLAARTPDQHAGLASALREIKDSTCSRN